MSCKCLNDLTAPSDSPFDQRCAFDRCSHRHLKGNASHDGDCSGLSSIFSFASVYSANSQFLTLAKIVVDPLVEYSVHHSSGPTPRQKFSFQTAMSAPGTIPGRALCNGPLRLRYRTSCLRLMGSRHYIVLYYNIIDWFFSGDPKKKGEAVFSEHYKDIRALVREDRPLEFAARDDWRPLRDFPEPDNLFRQ